MNDPKSPEAEVRLPSRALMESPRLFRIAREAAVAKAAQALEGRAFRHRITSEIRVASWSESCITFFLPLTGKEIQRPYRKALAWVRNAEVLQLEGQAVQP